MPMEDVVECPACQNHKFTSLYGVKGTDLVRCKNCDLVYVPSPLPEVAALYKSADAYSSERAEGIVEYASDLSAKYRSFDAELIELETRIGGKGRVLEFGCRLGHFGAVAKSRGWDTFVTDYSEGMVQRAHLDYGLAGFVTPATKIPLQENKFDLIVAHDVVHRLSHPLEIIKQLAEGLDPRGFLVVTAPNFSSWRSRLLGKRWSHFSDEDSLIFFKPSNLQKLLESAGFRVVEMRSHKEFVSYGEIFYRLQYYSKFLGKLLLTLAKVIGRDHRQVFARSGKIYVFAQKLSEKKSRKVFPVEQEPTPILGVVCCPNCSNALYPQGAEIHCVECDSMFEIDEGVINFSKYAKRTKQSG